MSDHNHHHHHHDKDNPASMPFEAKMAKLLEHWIKHNEDHGQTYREWAARAEENHLLEIGALLKEVAGATAEITRKLEAAVHRLPKG